MVGLCISVSSTFCGRPLLSVRDWLRRVWTRLQLQRAGLPSSCLPMAALLVDLGLCCRTACGIFQTEDGTHVPCVGRWILNHWTAKEFPNGPIF